MQQLLHVQDYGFSMIEGYEATKEFFSGVITPDTLFCEKDLFSAEAIHFSTTR